MDWMLKLISATALLFVAGPSCQAFLGNGLRTLVRARTNVLKHTLLATTTALSVPTEATLLACYSEQTDSAPAAASMIISASSSGAKKETNSNLAYVVRVQGLQPIKGKDRIELATLQGWRCIVKKGEFAVGDLALYFAIGAVPDFDDPHFSFLRDVKGLNRIKTMKMGGVLSQGLLGPLDWMSARGHDTSNLRVGDDVSVAMGVSKYIFEEEAAQYSTAAKEPFPDYVPKTDAIRLQHDPDFFLSAIAGREIVVTRKEDGCSCTFIQLYGAFKICSRNFVWNDDSSGSSDQSAAWNYFEMKEKYQLQQRLAKLQRNVAVQGEIVGPKVNGNRLKLEEREFRVFDIYDIDRGSYLLHDEVTALCSQLQLPQVPLLYRGPAGAAADGGDGAATDAAAVASAGDFQQLSVSAFLQRADSVEYHAGVSAEGIVVKTNDDTSIIVPATAKVADGVSSVDCTAAAAIGDDVLEDTRATRVVFKVISNKYLLKHDL